jgi:hypothetical protein
VPATAKQKDKPPVKLGAKCNDRNRPDHRCPAEKFLIKTLEKNGITV